MKRRYVGIIFFIVLVFIFVMGYLSDYGNKELILEGSYQSEGVGKSGHFLQITFMEGKFYEYEDNILINSGEYKKNIDNVYLLKSEFKDDYFVLQNDNNFYFYSENVSEKTVYHMLLIDRVPTFYPIDSSYL